MFSPTRLVLARKRRGMTKKQLAEDSGVALRGLTAYEAGETVPSDESLHSLASVLGFPIKFFHLPEVAQLSPRGASFRALTKMAARQRDMGLASGELAIEFESWIAERFELPKTTVPDLKEMDPTTAAGVLRSHWGLGEKPIGNIIHLLESRGVRVFSLNQDCRELDAFCFWHCSTPFVMLNNVKSTERSRFDAAHELGHLVLHQHGHPHGKDVETAANAFASAFLMPRSSVLASSPRYVTVEALIRLKKIWNVSVAALAYRLHALGILSDWQYHTLMVEISKRGFRSVEPHESPRENSQVLWKVFEQLRSEGVTKRQIARELGIQQEELEPLVFGLVPFASQAGDAKSTGTTQGGPRLYRVK